MTKEEARLTLQENFGYLSEEHPRIIEAMKVAMNILSQPSLPSNLDEVALKTYPKMPRLSEPHGVIPADNKTHYLGDANEENRIAFKAGAEWMEEQGISCEAEAVKDVGVSFLKGALEKATKEFDGKIIVQIRKKEE